MFNYFFWLQVLCVTSICSVVHSSGVHHFNAPIGGAPVVTASSSQYFQRTFNRLVAAPPLVPVSVPPLVPVAPAPPVFLQPAQSLPAPLPPPQVISFRAVPPVHNIPLQPVQPAQPAQPVEPNVAIAIATAYAAPVATILLPPYPFGFPPGYGLIPQERPSNGDAKSQDPEQTTMKTTTQVEVQTTLRETETTTPLPAGSDTNFDQASSNQDPNFNQFLPPASRPQPQPSNQDINFRQYLAPAPPRPQGQPSNQNVNFRQYLTPQRPQLQPQPQFQHTLPEPHHHHHLYPHIHVNGKPQKLTTVVEIEKAPLAYIAPPPLPKYPHNHEAIKVVKHVHTFVPAKAKLIIRPVTHHHIRSVPVKVLEYKKSLSVKAAPRTFNVRSGNAREADYLQALPHS